MQVLLEPAFILHHRLYRETSLLLDLFTQHHGRITLVARGVRATKSKLRSTLQPFAPLVISYQGKTELMTLQLAEPQAIPIPLKKDRLLCGFYLNELLTRLLPKQDAYPDLYRIYHDSLLELATTPCPQKCLRIFEKNLLIELGYGLQLQDLVADQWYRYHPEQSIKPCLQWDDTPQTSLFSGKSLLALANNTLDDPESLRDAKRLMRLVLTPLLGPKPLHSRRLFINETVE